MQAYAAGAAQAEAEAEAEALEEEEYAAAEAAEEAQAQARAEARALNRAAASLKRTPSKSTLPVSSIETVLGLDFQTLTMEEVVDFTLVEFCALYKYLEEEQFRESQIMIQLKENLLKQILVLKAKNNHDNQSKLLS